MTTRIETISTFDNLLAELSELSLSVDVRSFSQPAHPLTVLRAGLNTHAEAASREASRFALVARLNVDNPNAGFTDVCLSLANSAAMLVANVQALDFIVLRSDSNLRATRACSGQTLMKDVRSTVRNIVKSVFGMAKLVRDRIEANIDQLLTTEDVNQVVAHCGRVLRMCEEVRQIPTTPFSAVKRCLLKTARLIKTSAQEIKEEHEADLLSTDAGDKALKSTLTNGLGVLRTSMNLLKYSLLSSESYYLAESSADTNAVSTSSSSLDNDSSRIEGDLDNVASASEALGDALIDFADALNTGGEEAALFGMEEEEEEEEDDENEKVEEEVGSKSASVNVDLLRETITTFLTASKDLGRSLRFTGLGLDEIEISIKELDEASNKFLECLKT